MKRSIRITAMLLALAAGTSCQKLESNGDLTITISPKETFVIPTSTDSCYDVVSGGSDSVSSPYVRYNNMTYQWNSPDHKINIVYIKLILSGGGLQETECLLAGDDLDATLDGSPGEIAAGDNTIYSIGCALKCGGLSFSNPELPSYVSGIVRVLGIATKISDSTEVPVYAEAEISAQYEGD